MCNGTPCAGGCGESEILEYQTEHNEPDPAAPIPPVPVVAREPVVTVPTVPQHVSCTTVVTSTGQDGGIEQLLPLDPLRVRATIIASDQAVVLCHSRPQAGSSSNQAASVPNPSGAYLPTGVPVVVNTTAPLWVAATTSTAARVTVIVERRSA